MRALRIVQLSAGLTLLVVGIWAGFTFSGREALKTTAPGTLATSETPKVAYGDLLEDFHKSMKDLDSADVVDLIAARLASGDSGSVKILIGYLCADKPLIAIKLLERVGASHFRGEWLELLGSSHPAEAFRSCAKEPDAKTRKQAVQAVVLGAAAVDPALAFEQVRANALGHLAIIKVFQSWSAKDPAMAARSAMLLDLSTRSSALNIAVEKWADADPESVIAWIKETRHQLDENEIEGVEKFAIRGQAKKFPGQSLIALDNLNWRDDKMLINETLGTIISARPEAVVEWLQGDSRRLDLIDSTRRGFLLRLAQAKPEAVIDMARDMPMVEKAALSSAFACLADRDIELAKQKLAEWTDNSPTGGQERRCSN